MKKLLFSICIASLFLGCGKDDSAENDKKVENAILGTWLYLESSTPEIDYIAGYEDIENIVIADDLILNNPIDDIAVTFKFKRDNTLERSDYERKEDRDYFYLINRTYSLYDLNQEFIDFQDFYGKIESVTKSELTIGIYVCTTEIRETHLDENGKEVQGEVIGYVEDLNSEDCKNKALVETIVLQRLR